VSKYITVAVAALILSIIALLTFQISCTDAKNDALNREIAQSKLQSGMQANIITQYSQEREYMNQLLTDRATRSAQQEKELNAQIKRLERDMRGIRCDIPQSVTDQLRESY
jgi:protoheme ferro-lyase